MIRYMIWDIPSGSLMGEFKSKEAAFAFIRAEEENAPGVVHDWILGPWLDLPDQEFDEEPTLTGDDLRKAAWATTVW